MNQIEEQPPAPNPPNPIEEVKKEEEEDDPNYDPASADADVAEEEEEAEVKVVAKKKRGRPRKAQVKKQPAKKKKKKEEEEKQEEDVCYICFDGGNLVCCDKRGCPKVYHAACINREEDFLTKGKWNCGWHICSICEKGAQYLCCTCTYSLCKGCFKNTEFVCVRGKKGFCQNCYSTVMLMESKGHDKDEKVEVNFDDKTGFEYLFGEYWFDVKRKLSLSIEELQNAEVQSNKSNASHNKDPSSDESYNINNDQEDSSDSSSKRRKNSNSSNKKSRRRSRTTIANNSSPVQQFNNTESQGHNTEWASKELLEFVAHMKGGDKSALSQFDVQALLLEYIKRNNLRDPRKKSQIICDKMLENIFGKARVGHFEMLKLLELHFIVKEASHVVTDDNQVANVSPRSSQVDEANVDGTKGLDKRRKTRKKNEERELQTNLDDYAAIDVHNISLIFLRRSLIEDMLDDVDMFAERVVGSFVRIRIHGKGQKQEFYRLVQVVGTSKAGERYKTGKKTTYFMLEVRNLDKKDSMTIDNFSNQDFTEEECKRLRQSIKLGLLSRFTVGDIQEKARVLQAVRVNEGLESEKQRLAHLRDRASETGRRKELRECVEKLQLLNSPEERIRRINQIPEIHSDPKMDPEYVSADEEEEEEQQSPDKNPAASGRPRDSSFRKGKELFSPATPSNKWASNENTKEKKPEPLNLLSDKTNEPQWGQEEGAIDPSVWNNNAPSTTTEILPPDDTKETEKIWNYKDPSGNIQGPFSIIQLRKWNTTGLFPVDLKIWRVTEIEDESILLSDALIGKFEQDLPQWVPPQSNYSHPSTTLAQNINPTSVANNPLEVKSGLSTRVWELSKDASAITGQPHQIQIQSISRLVAPTTYVNQYGSLPRQGVGDSGNWNMGQQDHRNNWNPNSPIPQPQPISVNQGYGPQQSNLDPQYSCNQWVNGTYMQSSNNVAAPPMHNVPQRPMGPAWGPMINTSTPGVHHVGPAWGMLNAPPPPPRPAVPMSTLNGNWGGSSSSSVIPNTVNQNIVTNATLVPKNEVKSNPTNVACKNQFFERDCPSPTPTNERLSSTQISSKAVKPGPHDNLSPIRELERKPTPLISQTLNQEPSRQKSENAMNSDMWSMPSPTPGINPPSSNNQPNLWVSLDSINANTATSSSRGWGTWQENSNPTANSSRGCGAWQENKSTIATIDDGKNSFNWSANQGDRNGWGSQDEDQYRSGYGRDSRHDDLRYSSYSRHDSRYDEDLRHDSRYAGDYSRRDASYIDDYSRRDSKYRDDSWRDSRYGGYERTHRDRGGRRSRTPPRGEGKSQGICKFHEGGHCKKGASCNYVHS